jgi:hypothetical protein
MEVSGQLHALAVIPLWKDTVVPFGHEAGWCPELVGREEEEESLANTKA